MHQIFRIQDMYHNIHNSCDSEAYEKRVIESLEAKRIADNSEKDTLFITCLRIMFETKMMISIN